jgi:hypothetical protein
LLIASQDPIPGPLIPLGYPVESKQVLVLDGENRALPAGEVGQLAVKSRYLSPGYWQQPELTATAYYPDPDDPASRIYLTGDVGRELPDGCLEYIGRLDSAIKVHGQRVEVAEIELALLEIEAVRDAVVEGCDGPDGEKRLVAYVMPRDSTALNGTMLRKALETKLPWYMLPSAFVFMDQLPLLPFGKVNRRALPKPDWSLPTPDVPYRPPQDETEELLCGLFAAALSFKAGAGGRSLGVDDNFLDLGGDSLRAADLAVRIRDALGLTVSIQIIYKAGTIAELARVLRQAGGVEGRGEPAPADLEHSLRRLEML